MRLGLLGTVRGLDPRVRPELHPGLPVGTELSAWASRVGVFPSTPVERAMQAIGHLEAGLSAAAAGVDAVAIDSLGDYGLDALRAALAIPVVGSGEAGMAAAAAHGRFAIVTVWPRSMNFVPEDLLDAYGHRDRCTGIRNVGEEGVLDAIAGPDGYLDRVNRADTGILGRVVAEIEAAVAEGAEAILLGCTCMSPMAAKVAAAVRVPVINPLAEAAQKAVALASACGAKGIITERAELVRRMVDAIAGEVDENCPVCVVAEAF
ncbi:MAG TPA: aspartate/glutamate racemase family protein [Sphingobium sp.]